jgi:hypothetical protein
MPCKKTVFYHIECCCLGTCVLILNCKNEVLIDYFRLIFRSTFQTNHHIGKLYLSCSPKQYLLRNTKDWLPHNRRLAHSKPISTKSEHLIRCYTNSVAETASLHNKELKIFSPKGSCDTWNQLSPFPFISAQTYQSTYTLLYNTPNDMGRTITKCKANMPIRWNSSS